jgi:hypothetical protein
MNYYNILVNFEYGTTKKSCAYIRKCIGQCLTTSQEEVAKVWQRYE